MYEYQSQSNSVSTTCSQAYLGLFFLIASECAIHIRSFADQGTIFFGTRINTGYTVLYYILKRNTIWPAVLIDLKAAKSSKLIIQQIRALFPIKITD
jgi:hypothetical protein